MLAVVLPVTCNYLIVSFVLEKKILVCIFIYFCHFTLPNDSNFQLIFTLSLFNIGFKGLSLTFHYVVDLLHSLQDR